MSRAAPDRNAVVIVTGPTAAGKSLLAVELAERFGGEIVNADSMQVYRGMDIGTAKTGADLRARIPHHLLDLVDPDERYSAGRYASEARAAAREIHGRGKLVVLTGGTGLYIRAFVEGLLDAGAADLALRERLEAEQERAVASGDPGRLYRRLAELDPESAGSIHANDTRRIVRALEIAEAGGIPASARRRDHGFRDRPYRVLHLAIDPGRELLDVRIDERCRWMIDAGLLQEVRELRRRGYGPELQSMQAIGYRHLHPVAAGSDTLANALEAMQRDTRRFARRQRTWLRAVPEAIWLPPDARDPIWKCVDEFLAGQKGSKTGATQAPQGARSEAQPSVEAVDSGRRRNPRPPNTESSCS